MAWSYLYESSETQRLKTMQRLEARRSGQWGVTVNRHGGFQERGENGLN